MSYLIIQPPFTLKFREMSADELRRYRQWFFEIIPTRVTGLSNAVNSSPDFADWKPDHSTASIEALGLWLSHQVETRARTTEEIDRIKAQTAFDFGPIGDELVNRTFSFAMDAGMYFGETIRSQYPHLAWHQPLTDKRFADFGQMVLTGFGRAVLNPVRICVTFCYGVASGRQKGKRLGEAYHSWCSLAGP
jgi:hypothetical protein